MPEAFTHDLQVHWGQHPLRPEFIESTYLLYRATKDPYYLRVARNVIIYSLHSLSCFLVFYYALFPPNLCSLNLLFFQVLNSLNKYCRVKCGFAGVKDLRTMSQEDRFLSFLVYMDVVFILPYALFYLIASLLKNYEIFSL